MSLRDEFEKILEVYEREAGLEHNVPGCAARLLDAVCEERGHPSEHLAIDTDGDWACKACGWKEGG